MTSPSGPSTATIYTSSKIVWKDLDLRSTPIADSGSYFANWTEKQSQAVDSMEIRSSSLPCNEIVNESYSL